MGRSIVVVQARLGSSRLPGKVLADLAGKTVLEHVLERCRAIQGASEVCCAVPVGHLDDHVAVEAARCGVSVIRGSEADVLDRYYQAAIYCGADIVMRVTSDCPVIDPYVAAEVLRIITSGKAEYACNNMPRTWPHGLDCEAFAFEWLEKASREASHPDEREHVTPFIRNHPAVRKANLECPERELSAHRWTLDTAEDLQFLRALFARFPDTPDSFSYRVPLGVLEREPNLALLNRVQH